MFVKQMLVGHMDVFAYLLGDEVTKEALVIDPADEVDKIIAEATRNEFQIKYIVNTHGHVDHTSGNLEMKKKTGAQILIHEGDAEMLYATPEAVLRMFGAHRSPPADGLLKDGDCLKIGNESLEVIHVPGHSPGCIALYAAGLVFTGDTLFVGGVGRSDLPGGSWEVMERSLRERLLVLPPETRVFPGHHYGRMPVSTIGNEKSHNPYL